MITAEILQSALENWCANEEIYRELFVPKEEDTIVDAEYEVIDSTLHS